MNLPNKLTTLRVILIPFFVFFMFADFIPAHSFIAVAIFIVASITDFLDGYIARKNNLVTNFGKFMDPLADKLLVICALISLLVLGEIGSNLILATVAIMIIVAREFIISGFRLIAADNGIVIAASMWGKYKTATTMVAIILLIIAKEVPVLFYPAIILFWVAVALTLISLVDYLIKNKGVLSDKTMNKH